jgi:hypothetical protein
MCTFTVSYTYRQAQYTYMHNSVVKLNMYVIVAKWQKEHCTIVYSVALTKKKRDVRLEFCIFYDKDHWNNGGSAPCIFNSDSRRRRFIVFGRLTPIFY